VSVFTTFIIFFEATVIKPMLFRMYNRVKLRVESIGLRFL